MPLCTELKITNNCFRPKAGIRTVYNLTDFPLFPHSKQSNGHSQFGLASSPKSSQAVMADEGPSLLHLISESVIEISFSGVNGLGKK